MADEKGIALGWDDEVEASDEWFEGPDGDYNFEIVSATKGLVEKGIYKGNKMVTVLMRLTDDDENYYGSINERFTLNTKFMWKINQFFVALGDEKIDGKVRMHWDNLKGLKGRCNAAKGEDNDYYNIKKFYAKLKVSENDAW